MADAQRCEKCALDAERQRKDVVGWVAYFPDWSGFRIFRTEIDALRHAVDNQMKVVLVHDGQDPSEVRRG